MRGSSRFLVGGLVLLAVGLALYIALVLFRAAGDRAPFTLGPSGLLILVAVFSFYHAWRMRENERMLGGEIP